MKAYELDLSTCALPLAQFNYDYRSGSLTAEASSLGGFRLHRLYNDAADVGIAIRSHHTGKVERFSLTREDVTPDGEVAGWKFVPVDRSCQIKSVLVIND